MKPIKSNPIKHAIYFFMAFCYLTVFALFALYVASEEPQHFHTDLNQKIETITGGRHASN